MDFKILEKAADVLQDKLRQDEAIPDISDQVVARSDTLGSHKYYIEPYKSNWGPMIEYGEFIPLPKIILEQYSKIECASFMGVLPEISRVWVTVDNKLFLWKHTESLRGLESGSLDQSVIVDHCDVYDGMSEVIVSVALSAPKPGIFLDAVKYVLVLASPVEIVLLAVTCDSQGNNFKLVPTAYKMASDNIAMVKVVGSQSGRIFMAGNDGNVYELDYSNSESVWSGLVDIGSGDARHKCRKINHFAWNWKFVHVLPPFLKSFGSEEDSLVDLAVDNVRHVVYAVTSKGMLSAFYLGASGAETQLFISAFNLMDATRAFLSGYNVPEGSPRPEVFNSGSEAGFTVLSLNILSPAESRRIQLVVALQNGIRIFLSLKTTGHGTFSSLPTPLATAGSYAVPGGVQVVYVRSPPIPAALRSCSRGTGASQVAPTMTASITDLENGSSPSFIPTQALRVSSALVTQGATLFSLDKQQHPDELVCLFEDLVGRSQVSLGLPPVYQPPSMREGVCVGLDESKNGGKIYDIKEDSSVNNCVDIAKLRALYAHSFTPSNASIREVSHHHDSTAQSLAEASSVAAKTTTGPLAWLDGNPSFSSGTPSSEVPVAFGGKAIAMACMPPGTGYDKFDLSNIAPLGELCWQHIPCSSLSVQRSFLVLTNQGIHTIRKLRPADVLYRNLVQVSHQADDHCQQFFSAFGALEASAMCVALACGLPCDAGGAMSISARSLSRSTVRRPVEAIQVRAMSVMLGLTQGPNYRTLGSLGMASAAIQDSRVVINNSSHEFVNSSAHDALYLVCSRILRPLWLRNVIQRDLCLSSAWTPQLIAEVRSPLTELQNLLKGFFATAVINAQQHQDQYLSALANTSSDDMITRQMLSQAQLNANAERMVQQRARALEDSSIHALYRLVSKALQALSFIEILDSVSEKSKIKIQWTKLGEVNFRALVVSPRVHENVKKVVTIMINDLNKCASAGVVDGIIDWLSRECAFYFSAGDRCTYEATKLLSALQQQIKSVPGTDLLDSRQWTELHAQSMRCVQLLLTASKYWRRLDTVQGEECELWRKCTGLIELDAVGRDGVVDICLAAADNFSLSQPRNLMLPESVNDVEGSSNWEKQLYCESVSLNDQEKQMATEACYHCLIQHIMTIGTDVRRLGAGILPARLPSGEVGNPLEIAQAAMMRMVVRAVSKCSDPAFYALLSDRLLQNHEDILLAVHAPGIEVFLTSKDPQLLYRYYEQHGDYVKAATLMSSLARDEADTEIVTRISFLQRAVASAERSVAAVGDTVDGRTMAESLSDLRDTLEIAEYQHQAHSSLAVQFDGYNYSTPAHRAKFSEGQRRSLDLLEKVVLRTQNKLLTISELFHDICTPYKLWDICLLILHASKHEDVDLASRLWRSYIYRIVPDTGLSDESQSFLQLKRDASRIEFDKRHQQNNIAFEQSEVWLPSLQLQVVHLAKQIMQSSGSGSTLHGSTTVGVTGVALVAFPSTVVLEELEEIAATLSLTVGDDGGANLATESKGSCTIAERGWTVRCFCEMGFSFGTLVESFMEIFDRWAGKSPEKLLHVVSSVAFTMQLWTKQASGFSVRNEACTRQLVQAARSGRLASWIEKLRRQISTLGARKLSAVSQELVAAIGKELTEVNRRVTEVTLA